MLNILQFKGIAKQILSFFRYERFLDHSISVLITLLIHICWSTAMMYSIQG
jgi:hypothetical protein